MTKFSSDLILWYKEHERDLPWRQTRDPYRIWVSEIILQQTRVNQGLMYYGKFIDTFPTVTHLAKASEDKVLLCWQGLGYYSRARNMHFAAKYIVYNLSGKFPDNYTELLKLKGVGTYTAAAISSICFNEHRTVVDGNVFRVLTRLYGIETPVNTSKGKKEIEELAHSLNNGGSNGEFNQALMEFGALHCTPKQPKCDTCIYRDTCLAFKNGMVEELPVKVKTLKIKKRYLTFIFFIDHENNTIIQRRNGSDIWKGLYQFPLIETQNEVLSKELLLKEEFIQLVGKNNVEFRLEEIFNHTLTHRKLRIKILELHLQSFSNLNHLGFKKVGLQELSQFPFPKPLESYIKNICI